MVHFRNTQVSVALLGTNMCERTYNLVGFSTASEVSEGDQRLFVKEAKTFEDLSVSAMCVFWSLEASLYKTSGLLL